MSGKSIPVAAASIGLALALFGCGDGGSSSKNEASGTYKVAIDTVKFPSSQRIGEPVDLKIKVRNAGSRALPAVAVSIKSFAYRDTQPDLSDRERPIWIVDQGPIGGETSFVSTWALGPLQPGRSRIFRWHVTAVKDGKQTLKYTVAAALEGDFKTELADGGPPEGTLDVDITRRPAPTRVGSDGQIVR